MSDVTNVILKVACGDENKVTQIEPKASSKGTPFVSCSEASLPHGWYGGNKFLECEIFPGAFNYLDINDLTRQVKTVKWSYPKDVQLWVQGQNDDRFREIDIGLL